MRDNTWTVMAVTNKGKAKRRNGPDGKEYKAAGFYCQNTNAKSPHKLVNKVLKRREVVKEIDAKRKVKGRKKVKGKSKGKERGRAKVTVVPATPISTSDHSFPPLPHDHGCDPLFEQEHDFVLPFDIHQEAESESLDGKKKPNPYQKLRGSQSISLLTAFRLLTDPDVFPERARQAVGYTAVCRCDPESRCGENCINRVMSYLCGKECPCGDTCENKSLAKREMPQTRVAYVGYRTLSEIQC